jgi:KDO2-lipid IV(A) lauroyltransferase
MAHSLGGLAARRSKRRPIVEANLARITGKDRSSKEVQDLVVASFRSYARYWLETFRLVREDRGFFLDRFHGYGDENIDEALKLGKGVIVAVGHLGNWDAAGAWVGARGNRLVTVAEVLKPRRMFDFFKDHRARLGMTIFPAEKGATERLAEAVESGAVVAILADRDLKGQGPEVTFFGERVTFPAGAASVLFRTKAPLLVGGVFATRFDDGRYGWEAHISPPLDVPTERSDEAMAEVMQAVATALEAHVRARPEEWHVMQPFWPSDKSAKSATAAR